MPSAAEGPASDLVVLLHGYAGGPRDLADVEAVVRDALASRGRRPTIVVPKLPLSVLSTADPHALVDQVVATIESRWNEALARDGPAIAPSR